MKKPIIPGEAEEFDPESHVEFLLINDIRHEIMNFRPGFLANKTERTFFLSDAGSDWFRVTTNDDTIVIAVPFALIKYLCFMDIINITVLNKKKRTIGSSKYGIDPAFQFVFKIGRRDLKLFGALRVRCSEKIGRLLRVRDKVTLIAVDEDGIAMPFEEGRTAMELVVLKENVNAIHEASWEKYGIEEL